MPFVYIITYFCGPLICVLYNIVATGVKKTFHPVKDILEYNFVLEPLYIGQY